MGHPAHGSDSPTSTGPASGEPSTPTALERTIARILQRGISASVVLLGIGLALMLAHGISPLDRAFRSFSLGATADDILALRPGGFLWLGLVATIATPSVRVLAALVGYGREGDRHMALVSAGILVVILASVVIAGLGSR